MLIALIVTSAFAGPTDFDDDASDGPPLIVNGQLESGYPSTVGLGAFGNTICTGSLITPRIVLSAAHCGGGIPNETIVNLGKAFIGPNAADADPIVGFDSWTSHPDYVPLGDPVPGVPQTLSENDVGIVVLSEAVDIEPVWFRSWEFTDEDIGEEVISVGFGTTNEQGEAQSTKRSATLIISDINDEVLESRNAGNDNSANICSGDSGGPMYYVNDDGSLIQWGVHSWGDENCSVQSASTRTDIVTDFILEHVLAVHGTTDFCEIMEKYDNGVCDESCDNDPECAIEEEEGLAGCGCATAANPTSAGWLVGLLLLGMRRRNP